MAAMKPRMSARAKMLAPGVGAVRVTGGLVDLSLVTDYDAIRARARAERQPSRAERAAAEAAREPSTYAGLVHAWEAADSGAPKRTALAALRAHESRHGREPYRPVIRAESRQVDISTGAESWLEVK